MLSEIHGKMQTDQYHPEKLLASGPSAKVYRGVESMTLRKVLIKALLPEHETPNALDWEKLQLMAPALMQVRHPQIAGLITLMPTEDEFALVYDFMPGKNVRALAAERQISAADIRALAVQFMHALLVGEQLRQPHGDPKPSNIIIAESPGGGLFLQVQDWGLSLARTSHPEETLWFRAPELHYSGVSTTQSDLFTAAATLFCLATNTAPAQGAAAADLVQQWQVFNAAHALHHMRPDIDPQLRDWLAWLMQTNLHLRPRSVAQALEVLMPTMHTGFIYMPQQAPQMMPGTQTMPLMAPPPPMMSGAQTAQPVTTPPVSLPRQNPNAPKPKPVVAKPAPGNKPAVETAAAATATVATPPKPKRSRKRLVAALTLNLVALVIAVFFLWPAAGGAAWSNWLAGKPAVATTAPTSAPAAGKPKALAAPPVTADAGVLKGRYVRIELKGKVALSLAEVQVFSGKENIASQGEASQSSTASGGKAALAIDGNTDGDMPKSASVMQTDASKANPWWQLDLGKEVPLNSIVLWSRTDGDDANRNKGLVVKILSAHQRVVWEKKDLPKPEPQLKVVVE